MDHRDFDRLTRRIGSAGSRRQVLRAALGAALVGVTTTHAAAVRRGPKGRGRKICVDDQCPPPPTARTSDASESQGRAFCCSGTHCSCNGECCNNRCFWVGPPDNPSEEFCCTGPDKIMCGGGADARCCKNEGPNPCASCKTPSPTGLAGSYRRP